MLGILLKTCHIIYIKTFRQKGFVSPHRILLLIFFLNDVQCTLEETAALFDGTEAVQDITYRAAIHAGLDLDTQLSPPSPQKEPRALELKRYRSSSTTPSPLSEKRRSSLSTGRKLPDNMTYVLEVQKPDEIHSIH